MFSPFTLPSSIFLLVTDELPSPADFSLYQTLITHLKQSKSKATPTPVVWFSVSESLTRLQTICSKSGVNLVQHIESGSMNFIDISSEASLRNVHSRLRSLSEQWEPEAEVLVILDDVSSLEWTGHSPLVDIVRFVRAIRALCLKRQATFLVRHHIATPAEPETDQLLRHLLQMCNYHMDVKPLSSGRSGSISGEVALHLGPSEAHRKADVKTYTRDSAIQYRLTDSGVVFFERGSSNGVL